MDRAAWCAIFPGVVGHDSVIEHTHIVTVKTQLKLCYSFSQKCY